MKYMSIENHPSDSRVKLIEADICQTLSSRMGTGGGNVPLILVINDQGGGNIDCSEKDISPTLRAETHGHLPMVMIDEASDRHRSIQSMHHRGGIKDIEFGG